MGYCIAIAQQKAGSGKTTTAINLGAALAEAGCYVLLIDFDPQGALTASLGVNPGTLDLTIYDVLRDDDRALQSVIVNTESGCELVPANIDLAAGEVELMNEIGRERIFALKLAPVIDAYDFILIDCPLSLGLLTINALTAADSVIVPVQCQHFALRGLETLLRTVARVRARLNPKLHILGILPTLFDGRTMPAREVLEELQATYGAQVFDIAIPQTTQLTDSIMAGKAILTTDPTSPAAAAFRELAQEVLKRD